MNLKFNHNDNKIEVIDPIKRSRYRISANNPVAPTPVECNQIDYPVSTAIQIITDGIEFPREDNIYIRGEDGSLLTRLQPGDRKSLPNDDYTLELAIPMKIYISVKSAMTIFMNTEQIRISFEESTRVVVGTRSYHTRPVETIATTPKPTDVMKAVSTFGSALKTTSSERSYPTLRGHPPAIELGNQLEIPDGNNRLKSDIQIELPPTLEYVFIVAPLAYYLGATVKPATEPRLRFGDENSVSLDNKSAFETTVERILKRSFFLDCVVRTEGNTPLPLHERQMVEPELECNIEMLYNQSMSERLETYLDIPYDKVSKYIPEWSPRVRLKPAPRTIPFLPYIADSLSIISIRDDDSDPIYQGRKNQRVKVKNGCDQKVNEMKTISQIWQGINSSEIRNTTPLSAFHHSNYQSPKEGPVEINVVCNDQNMNEELIAVHGLYGDREELPFGVTVHHNLSVSGLEDLLKQESDFFHYIGHIDRAGFRCTDGNLDASEIETVGVKTFFLNACNSYNHGLHLIDAGSIGGIVTLTDVNNKEAVIVGSMIVSLLNMGLPLTATVGIVQEIRPVGQHYQIIGDGTMTIAQPKKGVHKVCSITHGEKDLKVSFHIFSDVKKGAIHQPEIKAIDSYHLIPGTIGPTNISKPEFIQLLEKKEMPILLDGELRWSNQIKIDEL